jgi:hypothetical protein
MCLNLTNDSEVTIVQSYRYCWKYWFELKEATYRLRTLGLNEAGSKGMPNIKVIGNYINSLKRVKTQNFDIERTKWKGLKLKGFLSYDIELESIFLSFPWLSWFASWCNINVWCHATCRSYTFLTKRKRGVKHRCRTCSQWQIALIHVVSSSGMTYANVVSIPAEKYNIYGIHHHLSPSGAHAFNAVWTVLHTLWKHIHVLRKRP